MVVYIIFFTILILFSTEQLIYPDRKSQLYYLGVGLIILFVSCRGNGFDWNSYENIYTIFHSGGERRGAEFVEYGFQWLSMLSPTYRILIFIIGVLSSALTLKGTYYFSKSNLPVLGLVIFATMYLLGTYMGQIRQAVAMGCLCMAIRCNYSNERRKSIIWIGIGMLFHMTAILGVLVLFTPKRKLSYLIYGALIVASIIGYGVCLRVAAHFLGVSDSAAAQKAMVYAQSESESLSYSTVIIRIVTLWLALYFNKDKEGAIAYISNIYVWSIVIFIIFGFLPQLASRGSYYFAIYDMILLPFIVKSLKRKHLLFVTAYLMVLGLSGYRMYSAFRDPFFIESYVPYIKTE